MKDIMKLLIQLTAFLLYSSSLFGQLTNADIKLSDYLKTVKAVITDSETKVQDIKNSKQFVPEMMSPLDEKTMALKKHISSLPINDFLNLVEKRGKIDEEDLFAMGEFTLKHDEDFNKKSPSEKSIRWGIVEGMVIDHLAELYGDAVTGLIVYPVLLKVKITKQQREIYKVDERLSVPQNVVFAEIEDILKGGKHLKVGKVIQFYYMDFWTGYKEFNLLGNESYFISLAPVVDNKNEERGFALNVNNGPIRVSENILQDNNNYYKFGKISWEEFKKKVLSSIDINLLKEVKK